MVVERELYDQLEIEPSATNEDIKKSYRKLAKKFHPDRNDSSDAKEVFQSIGYAFEILNNPKTREQYDNFGKDSLQGGNQVDQMDPMNVFESMFGGSMGSMFGNQFQQQQQQQNKPQVKIVKLSLQEAYLGKKIEDLVLRVVKCGDCDGLGYAKNSKPRKCTQCNGHKMVNERVQVGPGMFKMNTKPCTVCRQKGIIIDESSQCKKCNGTATDYFDETLIINIPKGVENEKQFLFKNKADFDPSTPHQANDLVYIVQISQNDIFQRNAKDLKLHLDIPLINALTGFTFSFKHLDGRTINIKSPVDTVIKPDTILYLPNEGMIKGQGHLFIEFVIIFPDKITNSDKLIDILPDKMEDLKINKKKLVTLQILDTFYHKGYPEEDNQEREGVPEGVPQCAQS